MSLIGNLFSPGELEKRIESKTTSTLSFHYDFKINYSGSNTIEMLDFKRSILAQFQAS